MKPLAEMTTSERELAQKCVDAWRRAGPELERMRRADIRRADTALSIPAFDGLFEGAIRDFPAKPMSGLVEQQRWFQHSKP